MTRDVHKQYATRHFEWGATVVFAMLATLAACSGEKGGEPEKTGEPTEAAKPTNDEGDLAAQEATMIDTFAGLYRDNMKSIEPRLDGEFEHAEEMVLAMGILDPASPAGAKELEERLAQVGIGMDRAREILRSEGMGRRLTEAVSSLKQNDLKSLYQKMSEKKIPSLSGTKEGCQALPALIDKAREACVAPNTLARLHMGIFDCKSRNDAPDTIPKLPPQDQYRSTCLEGGALWPLLIK